MSEDRRPPDDPEPTRPDSDDPEGSADSKQTDITQLLDAAGGGDPQAAQKLLPLVYDQLRKAAQKQMAEERRDHTLQATALVHEAYIRLVGSHEVDWENRAHFYVAAAEAMRRVLVEHARKRGRVKRGGDRKRVPLSAVYLAEKAHPCRGPAKVNGLPVSVGPSPTTSYRTPERVHPRFLFGRLLWRASRHDPGFPCPEAGRGG